MCVQMEVRTKYTSFMKIILTIWVIIPYSLCLEKKKLIIPDIQSLLFNFYNIQENYVHSIYKFIGKYTS